MGWGGQSRLVEFPQDAMSGGNAYLYIMLHLYNMSV